MRVTALALLVVAASALHAQQRSPSEGGSTVSLGQPREWKWTLGAAAGRHSGTEQGHGLVEGRVAVHRDLVHPVAGVAAFHLETYLGYRERELDPGVRLRVTSPAVRLGVGADFTTADRRAHAILSFAHPLRRGGPFGDGGNLRIDYVPGRRHSISIGLETPIARRIPMGSTRPVRDHVPLRSARLPATPLGDSSLGLVEVLASARETAGWIRRLTLPFIDHAGWNRDAARTALTADLREIGQFIGAQVANGHGDGTALDTETRRFHALLEHAFSVAVAGRGLPGHGTTPEGRRVSAHARTVLLHEVLLPYDRLLGQSKRDDTTREFAAFARGAFLRWLHVDAPVPADRIETTLWVFAEILWIVEANRAAAREQWGDSRFVWLPLQFALLPEDHDTQAELDALLELAVRETFTDGNLVSWVINEQFQYHLSRTIARAEEYHVLWTHDFRGFDAQGDPDEMSFRHVLRSYLRAMTNRVRTYDSTGTFPVYVILLDEWFYHVTQGRLWMNLLEDPTGHRLDLPAGFEAWEDSIAAAQAELREAIAASTLLQAQARQYGTGWLRNLVKVHVNITNPADPSFSSRRVIRGLAVPDNMMRDHRKILFYDITEADPYRGEALYTGAGVGEHYANASWEDRSILVRGPAALGLKDAAREALINQGISAERIPYALRAHPKAVDYDEGIRVRMENSQQPLRAVELHNSTGFAAKRLNVAKAVLYTLMPPGSVIKIPDSLWNSGFWGSALLGGALRGVRVLIIAPAMDNAPAQAFGTLARGHELLWRLLEAQRLLGAELDAAGGMVRVGLYTSELAVMDIPGKVRAVQRRFQQHAWLRDLFQLAPEAYAELADMASALRDIDQGSLRHVDFESDSVPKLHLKANLFASGEAWTLMTRPEWGATAWEFVLARIAQVQSMTEAVREFREFPDAMIDVGSPMVQDWFGELEPAVRDRVVFYTIIGSQNQNYRSMVIDGEVGFVVSGWPSIIPYLDLISLIGQSEWPEDPSELARFLPEPSPWTWRLTQWIKLVL